MTLRRCALVLLAGLPLLAVEGAAWLERRTIGERLAALALSDEPACEATTAIALPAGGGPLLASWQTVSGCGAGAATGTGAGIKWIGRNVTGGLVHVECQGNYVKMPYGYNYIATTRVSADVGRRWNLAVSAPFLYKYMNNPFDLPDERVDVSNQGLGDLTLLGGLRFGQIEDWQATLAVGLPTGIHDAQFRKTQYLPQDRQLGLGRPTASLILDHTRDHDWGLTVLGGSLNWRGGTNDLGSYRAPSASAYAYTGYLLGPLVPAAGLSVTGFAGRDLDRATRQGTPIVSVAANLSLEWSTDWVAILLGASFPYDHVGGGGEFNDADGWGPWIVGLGVAAAPF
jgi:hypothetical protein